MFEKEIQELKLIINEKIKSLNNKELNKIRIRLKEVKDYEKAMRSIKCDENSLLIITVAMLIVGKASFYINFDNLSSERLFLASVSFPAMMLLIFGSYFIDDYFKSKKIMGKITKEKYEHLKDNEKRDKQLKISIENEHAIIKQEIKDLKEHLTCLEKEKDMQKLGYKVELILLEEEIKKNEQEQQKAMYEQLWNEYLEEKIDYSQVHFDSKEIDYDQRLVKKF